MALRPSGRLTPSEAQNGWVEKNNFHMTAERIVSERHLRALWRERTDMLRNLRVDEEGGLPVVPPGVKYLFLGEVHHRAGVQDLMLDMILSYRARYRERKVIVLTEFAEDSFPSFTQDFSQVDYTAYRSFFEELALFGIPVAGLEERAVMADTRTFVREDGAIQPAQTTAEGRRLRNLHWGKRIGQWREKYPDAVFIIYAGNAHVEYGRAYSVSSVMDPQETYVFSIQLASDPGFNAFHAATQNRFARPGALLSWGQSKWARRAGFDAAFMLPD